ncbi:MAG TPA: hypothetical protein VK960_07045 [Acidimicrobiia bacterium]|nr:hypothetical protein [Acidimicrobiia bacterium]
MDTSVRAARPVDLRVFPTATSLPSSFGIDGDGRLYATSLSGGTIYLIEQTT